MPGLSDLKIKIKNQPHGLAWINDKERSVLKAMGGSGKSGPMGIPAYDFTDEDDEDIGGGLGGQGGQGGQGNDSDPYGEGIDEDPFGGKADKGEKGGGDWTDPDDLWNITYTPPNKATGDPGGWGRAIKGLRDTPHVEKGLEKYIGNYIRSHPMVKGIVSLVEGIPGFPKGKPLSVRDVEALDRISWAEISGPPKDPDRDGINDGSEDEEILLKTVEEEEKLTPMQKYFRDKEKTEDNPDKFGDNQMTPEERLITSLGIENRIIQPFNEWLATQEERVRNLPRWLQATQYREYAKNRTSPASSYQPVTAPVRKTESITDKTPATTELFKRLGMKTGGYINDNIVERQMGGQATPMMGQATQALMPQTQGFNQSLMAQPAGFGMQRPMAPTGLQGIYPRPGGPTGPSLGGQLLPSIGNLPDPMIRPFTSKPVTYPPDGTTFPPILPPWPPYPEPPYPEPPKPEPPPPPPPPPEPEIIYDPEREAAAKKAAEQLQARRVAELGEAPQTRAEREALQAEGGFYRDEEGQIRDAMGNLQENFGFDYVAPPPPDPYDPPDTPDTPPPPEPEEEEEEEEEVVKLPEEEEDNEGEDPYGEHW